MRKHTLRATCDQQFDTVLQRCAERRTWINPVIKKLYSELFAEGQAHSIEVWHEDKLVGGLYGVTLQGMFIGESMFGPVQATKVAFVHLAARLKKGGFVLIDSQTVSEHFAQFGGKVVSKEDFSALLGEALLHSASFPVELTENPLRLLVFQQREPDN